ncbi:MAG: L-threonylcarbamoyladenylate synthase [Chitinophagales bacterium]
METVTGTNLETAAAWLKQGDVVAIPTETVYGLAANALDEKAVVKIFEAKNRPFFDPLIVHVKDREAIHALTTTIEAPLNDLLTAFSPGPITVLLPKNALVPDLTTSGLSHVGIRIPAHPLLRELLQMLSFPLAAPSANPFGYISPTTAAHVMQQLQGKIPYVLDGGRCDVGVESTIVGMEGKEVVIYRAGGISVEAIESVVGKVTLSLNKSSNPLAPGQLATHYAPRKPLYIGHPPELLTQFNGRCAVLSFHTQYTPDTMVLSPTGNLKEAARQLFHALRELDASDCDQIISEVFPNEGLGRAINDRLTRASVR